jgi:hypothetical protein
MKKKETRMGLNHILILALFVGFFVVLFFKSAIE